MNPPEHVEASLSAAEERVLDQFTDAGLSLYLVRGYTKTGVYAEEVKAPSMEAALAKGKEIINGLVLSPVRTWLVDPVFVAVPGSIAAQVFAGRIRPVAAETDRQALQNEKALLYGRIDEIEAKLNE